ncbi:replication-relaxation family protein [Kitasatospora sp. NPDC093679]|uniref:replication-relaxation family protein n=1 Tax=Kitasatospora sp. NPDC093679 TaxID=3154983 RepID=UPI00343559AA
MPTATRPAPVGQFDYLALSSLFQHRCATSEQLRLLAAPQAGISFTLRKLRGLQQQGLVAHTNLERRARLWFLTDAGRSVAARMPEMNGRDSPPQNLGDVQARILLPHTQAVLRSHLAFLADARRRGDEYGPLDWAPEVHHQLSERRRDALRADALMHYTLHTPAGRVHLRAFVELDRCTTTSEQLTSKLTAYARFHEHTPIPHRLRGTAEAQGALPVWQDFYPVFPRLLFILADASALTMSNRIADLQLAAGEGSRVVNLLRRVPAGAATLDDIESHGPSAPVWKSLAQPDRPACSWADL